MTVEDRDLAMRSSNDRLGEVGRTVLADQLIAQRDVLELELYALKRWLIEPPASGVVRLAGANGRLEETVPGDQRDPFNGVAILNRSAVPAGVGFAAGGAIGTPIFWVPAGTFLTVPVRFVDLSIGLANPVDAQGPEARVEFCRLRVPPMGIQAGQLTATDLGGLENTRSDGQSTAAAPASGTLIAALTGLTPGVYRVTTTTYEPTAPDANASNINLNAGGVLVGECPSTPTPILTPWPRVMVPPAIPQLELRVGGNAGGAGAIYFGSIQATRTA